MPADRRRGRKVKVNKIIYDCWKWVTRNDKVSRASADRSRRRISGISLVLDIIPHCTGVSDGRPVVPTVARTRNFECFRRDGEDEADFRKLPRPWMEVAPNLRGRPPWRKGYI
jgi:hypothetical protein